MQQTYQSAGTFTRRIGNTNYRVKIHYGGDENVQEKVLRMIQNDIASMNPRKRASQKARAVVE